MQLEIDPDVLAGQVYMFKCSRWTKACIIAFGGLLENLGKSDIKFCSTCGAIIFGCVKSK